MTIFIPAGRISSVISFVTGAWTAGWLKLVLIAALIGGGFWWFRIWLNRHDDRIFQDGKNRAVDTMKADYDLRLKLSLAEAKAISDTAAKDRAAIDARLDKLEANIGGIFSNLGQIREAVKERQVVYVEKAGTVPLSDLDDAMRALSADIARQAPH